LEAARIDALLGEQFPGEDVPDAHELLRRLIYGAPLDDRFGSAYGYLLEHLCGTYGQRLSSDGWSATSSSLFGAVQAALGELGVPEQVLAVESLINGRGPIPLPPPDDFPAVGFWELDEVTRAAEVLDGLELGSVSDRSVRNALSELQEWVRHCRAERLALVCFYY
jgi:hypothetical protein